MSPRSSRLKVLTAHHGERGDAAYDILLEKIISGGLPEGTRLIEDEIARRLNVSRTPVRDAIARLAAEGFLVTARGSRRLELIVAPLTADDLEELWSLVSGVEAAAVGRLELLAPRVRKDLADQMERINEELDDLLESRTRDGNRYRELQRSFHGIMVETCGGPRIRAVHARLHSHVARYETARARMPGSPSRQSIIEHSAIIGAIREGASSAAIKTVIHHWQTATTRAAAAFRHRPSEEK